MSNSWPVENEHSSEQSQATIAAISLVCTKRFLGTCSTIHFTFSVVKVLTMSVSATDGQTALTRISVSANSRASALVSAMTAALDAP